MEKKYFAEKCIRRCSIMEDVEILGHVFHGLADIKKHVEMSLYRRFSGREATPQEPESRCNVHVGELWVPYPCFDFEDFVNENRTYQNYIFRRRPITQDDMKKLSDLPGKCNECRVTKDAPEEMLPMVYYVGDGYEMLVAT